MKRDQLFEENVPIFAKALADRGIDPILARDVAQVVAKPERSKVEQVLVTAAWKMLKFPPNEVADEPTN